MQNHFQHQQQIYDNSLFNVDSSSLPSVLTDPGPSTIEERNFTDYDEGDDYNNDQPLGRLQECDNGGSNLELTTDVNANEKYDNQYTDASASIVGQSISRRHRPRNKRTKTQSSGRIRASSQAKRSERKRRCRTHSDTDLRKMRPIIASPFMPTLVTQISSDAQVASTSQDREVRSKKAASLLTNNNYNSGFTAAASKEFGSITTASTANAVNCGTNPGMIKIIGHSKYGSLPLKKSSTEAKPRKSLTLTPNVKEDDDGEKNSSSSSGSDDDSSSDDEGSSSESDSSSSSSGDSSTYASFSKLTKKQWATVGMLAIANLCSTIAFSCIAPFYPAEAQDKGMSTAEIGIVFGIFELVMFFSAPLLGKYMAFVGSKRMFTTGLIITGCTAITFGFLNYLPANRIFFWSSLTIRCAEALGDACFVTSSFAISAKCFPGRISTIVGIMETFAGLGYTAGPVIGSVLYEYGGFQLPFLVLGFMLLGATVLSYYLVEDIEDEPTDAAMDMLSMLKIPVIWAMVFAVVICAISLSFFDPTLADHLSSFNLSTINIGLMFLLCGGIYTVTAPVWGLILDRWNCCNALMLFGSFATVVSMLLVGPFPLFNMEKNLVVIGIALAILGVAAGALYIPTFQNCLEAVKEHGYDDSFQTYGCVSGVFQSAFAFGAFIGPTLGGFSVQQLGFAWTTTIIGGINLFFIVILLFFFTSKHFLKKYRVLNTGEEEKNRYTLA